MDGRAESRGYARILVGVRLTILLACAGLLLFFRGDLSARLAGANGEAVSERARTLNREMDTAKNWAYAQWEVRERAVAAGDVDALRVAATDPVVTEDRLGKRWGRPESARTPHGFRVLLDSTDALAMVVVVRNLSYVGAPGWRHAEPRRARDIEARHADAALLAFVREDVDTPWRIALEVPLIDWPWPLWDLAASDRESEVLGAPTLRRHLKGAPVTNVVSVPLLDGRTLICGAVADRGPRHPADQYCIAALDNRPDVSYYLGSVRSSWPRAAR